MQTTEIIKSKSEIILASLEEFKKGPEVLMANEDRKNKAITVGNDILAKIQELGMNDELDLRANNFLANCTKANKEMKENRSPVTQIMDSLKKMYTEVENEIDPSKEGTVGYMIQQERNRYAQKKAKEQAERERLAQLELAKKQDLIDLKASATTQLSKHFNDHVAERKNAYLVIFNAITLDTYAEKKQRMENFTPEYKEDHFNSFNPTLSSQYHDASVFATIKAEVMIGRYPEFCIAYTEQMGEYMRELITKLPSKLAELQEEKRLADEKERLRIENEKAEAIRKAEMEKADEDRKRELEAQAEKDRIAAAERQEELRKQQEQAESERKQREDAEAAEIKRKQEEEQSKAAEQANITAQGEQTMAMFEKEAATAELSNTASVREGYEIVVLHPAGYAQIFAFWFERAGKDLSIEKIGNTKLDQMKTWCEKLAHKSNEKITSQFLQYAETFKAVNKKVA